MSLFSACEFKSYSPSYALKSTPQFTLRYSAELNVKPDGTWGKSPYSSIAKGIFKVKSSYDSAKAQVEMSISVDSLEFKSSERAPQEDLYMVERLKKYHSKVVLTRTGQILSLEEEPVLPPIEFSPLNFGRLMILGLPAFPSSKIKIGTSWESVQPLLDKFHPESQVTRRFKLESIQESTKGKLLLCSVDFNVRLEEGLPTLTGKGEMEFDLESGGPISANLEVEGRFVSPVSEKTVDSQTTSSVPLRLKERLSLRFSN